MLPIVPAYIEAGFSILILPLKYPPFACIFPVTMNLSTPSQDTPLKSPAKFDFPTESLPSVYQ